VAGRAAVPVVEGVLFVRVALTCGARIGGEKEKGAAAALGVRWWWVVVMGARRPWVVASRASVVGTHHLAGCLFPVSVRR
jgi:hypothetical protein